MPTLSVIIPTYKRAAILAECLKYLGAQTIAKELEVIVVSDGKDAAARKVVEEFRIQKSEFRIIFLEVPKSQQGVARNEGVKHATSSYVLFIGDDIFLEPSACEKHLQKLSEKNAVLGFTTWDPRAGITKVMRWLEQSGWQFGYPMIAQYAHRALPSSTQHQFTYTSHISLPLSVAKQFPFRTDVTMYGWEDIEWGMRLRAAGIALVYEPDAKAFHHHHIEIEDSLKRMETLGRSAKKIAEISPEFDRVPKGLKLLAYRLLSFVPTLAGKHRKAFLKGLKQ
jgi:glycosyltransferase involved in cell wall biosynthesis